MTYFQRTFLPFCIAHALGHVYRNAKRNTRDVSALDADLHAESNSVGRRLHVFMTQDRQMPRRFQLLSDVLYASDTLCQRVLRTDHALIPPSLARHQHYVPHQCQHTDAHAHRLLFLWVHVHGALHHAGNWPAVHPATQAFYDVLDRHLFEESLYAEDDMALAIAEAVKALQSRGLYTHETLDLFTHL